MVRLGLFFEDLETAEVYDGLHRQQLRRQLRESHIYAAFSYLSDTEFSDKYRLNKIVASELIHELDPFLPRIRSTSVSVVSKVLTALEFYASGSYQRIVGQCIQHSIAQQTVSKCLYEVTEALNSPYMTNKYIKFPRTQQEKNIIKRGFYEKFRLPGVLGCVDGTHIAIVRPMENEERYYNRKTYHSLNTQIVGYLFDGVLNTLLLLIFCWMCSYCLYIPTSIVCS